MSKLVRYYFKRDKWILLAMVGCALLSALLLWTVDSGGMLVLFGVVAFLFSTVIAPFWLAIRDYKRMYGAYGSFFAALPLTGKEVIGGRALWFLFVQLLAFFATVIFFGLIFLGTGVEVNFQELLSEVMTPIGRECLLGALLLMLTGLFFTTAMWVFVTSVGSEKPLRRFGIGGPILLYVGAQVALNVVFKVVGDAMGSQVAFVDGHFMGDKAIAGLFLRMTIVLGGLMLIASVVMFLRSAVSHDKKLSIS
ncbi:MAG: hypothetical protein SOW18_05265 [Peptoniphilus sp.]|nr:hypothetical protein [Peptoniphilus sp.]MDY3118927.1 hypothetical protein [Peptoniphilus sp.]